MRRTARLIIATIAVALASVLAVPISATAAGPDFDFVPGSPDDVYAAFEFLGTDYVAAFDGSQSRLYSFDGTTFVDVGVVFDDMDGFTVLGSELYFAADDGTDYLLHVWSGAGPATAVPASPSDVDELVVFGSALYFTADNGSAIVLFRWDGSSFDEPVGGTVPTNVAEPTVSGGVLAMVGDTGSGDELVFWDGTTFTSQALPGGATCPAGLTAFGGLLVFEACVAGVSTLMTFNGSAITVIPGTPPVQTWLAAGSGQLPGALFFSGDDGTDLTPYVFDGTTLTAVPGAEVVPLAVTSYYVPLSGEMFFLGLDSLGDPVYYRWSAGTLTALVGPVPTSAFMTVVGGSLYVTASDGTSTGLWRYRAPLTPLLPATGTDGMPLLATGALLALAGVVLLARRRASAPEDARRT